MSWIKFILYYFGKQMGIGGIRLWFIGKSFFRTLYFSCFQLLSRKGTFSQSFLQWLTDQLGTTIQTGVRYGHCDSGKVLSWTAKIAFRVSASEAIIFAVSMELRSTVYCIQVHDGAAIRLLMHWCVTQFPGIHAAGRIPLSLGRLTNLTRLYLPNNDLKGGESTG